MEGKITLTMIKPKAVESGHIGQILSQIEGAGFRIIAIKYTHLKKNEARLFYKEHEGKPFYNSLVDFMSKSPIVAAVLYKEDAVVDYRKLIGTTDPSKAEFGTIRSLYASSSMENAVHGSDSDENALKEAHFFFSDREIFLPELTRDPMCNC